MGITMVTGEKREYIKKFWAEIQSAGDELRGKPMPELNEKDFYLFHETGNRLVYEAEYFGRRKFLTVFGILAEFGDNKADVKKLEEVVLSVCSEKFWALPAHVNFDNLDENTIDLFAAETAQTLAEMMGLFAKDFQKNTVSLMAKHIVDRVLKPFLDAEVPYSWWETDQCNWSAVCAGSIGIATICLARFHEQQRDLLDWDSILQGLPQAWKDTCITRVCNALQCYLAGMEEDGACTEGLGYFSYGMSYFTAFAELLYEETKGKVNLMEDPKCEQIALFQQKCYFGKGVSLSFSDGSTHECFLPGLTAYLAHCYPSVKMPDYSLARYLEGDACYRWLTNERNIRWLMKYGEKTESSYTVYNVKSTVDEKEMLNYELLPSAQWMICKDKNGNGYAAKGGHNAENHNHNDVGSFFCVFEGDMLLTDLGAGEYTKEYFSDGRYEILCNRSLGHSVPLINEEEQQAGREYCADNFAWGENKKELSISFGQAYRTGLVSKLTRTFYMNCKAQEENNMVLQVVDYLEPSEQTRLFVENLVTPYEPVVDKNRIMIKGEHGMCNIVVDEMSPDSLVSVKVVTKEHSMHDGKLMPVYLLQWDVRVKNRMPSVCKMCITFQKL